MAKETGRKVVASNRKARHDYLIEDTYEAGLVLMGTEVKALRMGRASLVDGWAGFDKETTCGSRASTSPSTSTARGTTTPPGAVASSCCTGGSSTRSSHATRETGHTVVPLALYFKDGRAKVEIAVAKGKKSLRQATRPARTPGPP